MFVKKRFLIMMLLGVFFVLGCEKEEEKAVQTTAVTEETDSVVETETATEIETETKAETESVENTVADKRDYESYMASLKEQSDAIKYSLENEALTQYDMNMKSQELYQLWDNALNDLWKDIENTLQGEAYDLLLEKQLSWIEEKEKAVEEAGKEVEGGSMYPLVVNSEAAAITEERVYDLYEILK